MRMDAARQPERQVRGCVLLIPSELFRAAEQEAMRQGLSLEAYILTLLEQRAQQTGQEESG
jgi:predicted HicB family RNase H-like nuclease